MNDPFEAHGVTHLSASSINEFIANPARWLLHVSGHRDSVGIPAMWRGKAIDKAITKGMFDSSLSINDLVEFAVDQYNLDLEEARYEGVPFNFKKSEIERNLLPRYIALSIPHFRSLGTPIASQKKIKLEFEELPIPIIGYLDLQYDGIVRDIKTVGRLPTKVPESTCRQLAIYATAENNMPIIDYVHVTKSKAEIVVKQVDNINEHMAVVRQAANSMMRILAYSPDISEVVGLLMPDFDNWRWSDDEKMQAKKLWRMT